MDAAALAEALIRAPSVTPADAGAIGLLKDALEKLGFACTTMEFAEPGTEPVLNLYARRGRAGRHFCFAGHTDVVPPGDRAAWRSDPFGAVTRDGHLYGRGAADMKGAIACFVAAAAQFIASPASREASLSLLITGDEEAAAINGTRKLIDWLGERGERIDACIVGEPTSAERLGDMVKIGRRGSLNGYLTVHGKQGHTAYPHLADNAAHRLVAMLAALIDTPLDQGTAHFPASTLAVSSIDIGNPAANVIPATARAVFNVRFNDAWSSATLEPWLRRVLDGVGGRYELAIKVSGESFLVPPGEVSEILTTAIRRVTGRTPELSTTGGTSDARFLHRITPLAEFGLVGRTAHQVDECVALADLDALTAIYRTVLELYFAGAATP